MVPTPRTKVSSVFVKDVSVFVSLYRDLSIDRSIYPSISIHTFGGEIINICNFAFGNYLPSSQSHGWRSLVGCSSWGHEESDTTERLHFYFSISCIGEGNGNPLQCSCLENPRENPHRWQSLVGCRLWGGTELDTTEATYQQQQHSFLECY